VTTPAWVRSEVALALVALALLAPRLTAFGSGALCEREPDERTKAAVGYAQHRLWSDFLCDREETIGRALPPPTLTEYRRFLAGLGLVRRGDAAELLVLPLVDESRLGREIEVRLSQAHPPLELRLYVPGESGRPQPVGKLEIRVDADDIVTCVAAPQAEPAMFSYWPVRPTPLLP
jgi:hypothetical protein